ncbi:MAG: hypothetical protein QG613_690, partial [Pseudomonadota bacterium]|nr:hypothetical protein [Pseudomonadota bacterium]
RIAPSLAQTLYSSIPLPRFRLANRFVNGRTRQEYLAGFNLEERRLVQLCSQQRPTGVEFLRRTIAEFRANEARQHPFAKC